VLAIGVFALLVIGYGLVSGRLDGTPVTAPMVFVTGGLVMAAAGQLDAWSVVTGPAGEGPTLGIPNEAIITTAEIALALVLFTDAARLRITGVRRTAQLPSRLLLVGMPLTVIATGIVAFVLLDSQLVFWEALLLAAVVAPTDAALGEVVVTSSSLPVRIRQALNVESGLNDGLAVPLFTIFLALADSEQEVTASSAIAVIVEKIGWGVAVGVGVGLASGALVLLSVRKEWITGIFRQLTIVAIGVFAWWMAEEIGGSGFIAAFVAGLLVGRLFREIGESIVDFTEDSGQLLNLFIFFIFGIVSWELLQFVTWQDVVFAVLALTVLRMVPVAVALAGSGLSWPTVGFIGWFGPRGLASIILGYLAVAEVPTLPGLTPVVVAMTVTVLFSVYAHGLSAAPLVRRYARWSGTQTEDTPEMMSVPELPTRLGMVETEEG
jgi:NhaP-type Na+/H+ or K+/H+ antiporter